MPQFAKKCDSPPCGKDDDGGSGGGQNFVFVDVELTGWMITDPVDDKNQMELARKPGIMKIRANTEKHGTKFLHFAIDMTFTRSAGLANCVWWGRVERTGEEAHELFAEALIENSLFNSRAERSVLVVIDESAFVQTGNNPDVFVSESDDNKMGIWPVGTPGTWPGFKVQGSPTVTVVGDPAGDDFTATFTDGVVELEGIPPWERNAIHLRCDILDDITFTVTPKTS